MLDNTMYFFSSETAVLIRALFGPFQKKIGHVDKGVPFLNQYNKKHMFFTSCPRKLLMNDYGCLITVEFIPSCSF